IAGNAFLRHQATRWTDAARVHVIPTCVDSSCYPLALHERKSAGVQMIWVGSSSTLKGLERAAPLLEALGRQVPGLQLKVVCDRALSLRELAATFHLWNERHEAAEIAGADIGISWVPDDDWSRGKCGLKVLQYMAAGLPVIANPVGVHGEMVTAGETGFLAATEEQWVEAVARLARGPELRRRLGAAGRRAVEAE